MLSCDAEAICRPSACLANLENNDNDDNNNNNNARVDKQMEWRQ